MNVARLQPGFDEVGEIRKQVARRVQQDQREKISGARPDDTEEDAGYRKRNDGVRHGVEWRWIGAESLYNSRVPKNESGRVRQSKNERHQDDPSYL